MSSSPSRARTTTLIIMLLVSSGLYTPVFAEDSLALIINAQNPYSGSKQETINLISRLFLKKGHMWPESDIVCRPFDRPIHSDEHQFFIERILHMSEARLLEHWAKMKQLRGDTPPRKIKAHRILLKLIEKNPGAFGVVNRETAANLPKGIRVLLFF